MIIDTVTNCTRSLRSYCRPGCRHPTQEEEAVRQSVSMQVPLYLGQFGGRERVAVAVLGACIGVGEL